MTEKECIDVILRGLYEFRGTGKQKSPSTFLPDLSSDDERRISHWLEGKGYVKANYISGGRTLLKLETEGVFYCEEDSQSQPGTAVTAITFATILDSPGSSIIVGIQGQTIHQNSAEALQEIENLRNEIRVSAEVYESMFSMIGEFLDEIEIRIKSRKPIPSFYWDWMSRIDSISSIAEKIQGLIKLLNHIQ
ncbi:MAG TPA: hypothetical protein VFG10_09755 [Saprospiraceae bacterium]|nr:hypothetical protein [Saprospiraceae bacterium]